MTELAVPKGVQAYNAAVAEFNLRHPDRQIIIKDDYDKTQLMTMLMAGDGPALIDSRLVSFRDQTEYWEPLNEIYDELGLTGVLNEAAVKLGAVDHAYYGVVLDFYVQTLISAVEEENWDYEAFLRLRGISGSCYLPTGKWQRVAHRERFSLTSMAWDIQHYLSEKLIRYGLSGKELAVVSAMALGNRDYMETSLRNSYSATGASHILAVSGLHVGERVSVCSLDGRAVSSSVCSHGGTVIVDLSRQPRGIYILSTSGHCTFKFQKP